MPPFISIKKLTGLVSFYAVRFSPYACPEHLSEVLFCFMANAQRFALPEFPDEWPCVSCTREDLAIVLEECLFNQPFVKEWNHTKSGRTGYQFVSRYSPKPNPDDDFIDLDALRGGIIRAAIRLEQLESKKTKAALERSKPKLMAHIRRIFGRA